MERILDSLLKQMHLYWLAANYLSVGHSEENLLWDKE